MRKILGQFSVVLFILIAVFLNWFISPYRFEWEEDIKQIDEDAVDVLRFFNLVLSVIFIALVYLFRRDRTFRLIAGAAVVYCLFRLIVVLVIAQ